MKLEELLAKLNAIIAILGNVTLEDAKKWLEVEENAERLRNEGHNDEQSAPNPA